MDIRWRETESASFFSMLVSLACLPLLAATAMPAAHAHHLLPTQTLNCGESFPCAEAIKPRVSFWVAVFRNWDKKTAILHDPNAPERVYAVFNSGNGCHHSVRTKIARQRTQIQRHLRAIADKMESGRKLSNRHERHLAALFVGETPRQIRAAGRNIRCQSGVRDSFVQGLQRFNHYRPMVDKILKENNLPPDIRYLPFVESSYNPAAYSRAGAAGIWQIMPRTARVLGLELNDTVDERFDPEAATRAAAEYLKRAERRLSATAKQSNPAITQAQLNPFIITSYNYGVNGMQRAIRRVAPDFMAVLERHQSPRFQTAVKNFYASFLAARHVAVNAERYFGAVARKTPAPPQPEVVVLPQPIAIASVKAVFGLREAELRPLNRTLTRYVWNGLRLIPAGYRLRLPRQKDRWRNELTKLAALRPDKVIAGGDHYTVRRGDTLCGIARAVKVNCSALLRVNRIGNADIIRVGQRLVIPRPVSATLAAAPPPTYRVRSGDTACGIAARFGVSCRALIGQNRLGRMAKIDPGQILSLAAAELVSRPPRGLNADYQYIVRRGDSPCWIAQRFSVRCNELRRLNQLSRNAIIHPGQKLKIPGWEAPDTSHTAQVLAQVGAAKPKPPPSAAADNSPRATAQLPSPQLPPPPDRVAPVLLSGDMHALRNLLDTLPHLGIRVTTRAGQPVYTVRVEADETLGHFADWLGIGSLRALRELNQLRGRQFIHIGRQLQLPVQDADMVERFEQRRTDYHQVLSESLKEHYDLVGSEAYTVKRGDSLWLLSRQLGFPVWLLYRLNPTLRDAHLTPGQQIALPKLKAKTA